MDRTPVPIKPRALGALVGVAIVMAVAVFFYRGWSYRTSPDAFDGWMHSVEEGLAKARGVNLPVLVKFGSPG